MKGTPLTEATFDYIVGTFASEEAKLLQVMQTRAAEAGVPMIMISEEQARFLGMFLKAINARRVLDIGTLFGYSAAVMAKAVGPLGEVVTLEYDPKHAQVARDNFKHLGIENISLLQGPALDHMKAMADGIYDFIIIDADKPNYKNYLKEGLRLIRHGGVIAGDNAFAFGLLTEEIKPDNPDYPNVLAIREFNRVFASERSMFSAVVPVGDGLVMGVVSK